MQEDLFIRRLYRHKSVVVAVDIDLVNKQISLVEQKDPYNHSSEFKPKQWKFAERGLQYVPGWLAILDAMRYAMTEAAKELEALDKRNEKAFVDRLMALDNTVEKIKKDKK